MTTDIQLPNLVEVWLSTMSWQPDEGQQEKISTII